MLWVYIKNNVKKILIYENNSCYWLSLVKVITTRALMTKTNVKLIAEKSRIQAYLICNTKLVLLYTFPSCARSNIS